MSVLEPIHSFTALTHPLAQIRAAQEFFAQVDAFVADTWSELFVDDPPDEDAVEAVSPPELLDALASLGLRFEVAAPMKEWKDQDIDDGFWTASFNGGSFAALLHAWAYQVMDFVELDHRAFFEALRWTDLIFVPDREGIATEAYQLLLTAKPGEVAAIEQKHENFVKKRLRSNVGRRPAGVRRGEGPRTRKPAVIDRAATALRNAKTPLSPEELADRLKHKNLASLTAALHHAANYGKPKRLAGCIHREGTGQYRWIDDTQSAGAAARETRRQTRDRLQGGTTKGPST